LASAIFRKLGREHRRDFSIWAPWIDIGVCDDSLVEPSVSVREPVQIGIDFFFKRVSTVHVVYITAPQPSPRSPETLVAVFLCSELSSDPKPRQYHSEPRETRTKRKVEEEKWAMCYTHRNMEQLGAIRECQLLPPLPRLVGAASALPCDLRCLWRGIMSDVEYGMGHGIAIHASFQTLR